MLKYFRGYHRPTKINQHIYHMNNFHMKIYCRSLQTHSISIHPLCIKCQMLTGLLFSRAFSDPPESPLEQWDPWRAPTIEQWGPVSAPTSCVAHWSVLGHCVGVMAAHGVSLGVVFATSLPPSLHTHPPLPVPPHPAPPRLPSHRPPLLSILTAERDGKKYLVTKYFKSVFLEIPLGAN